jgi:hypothetical protein
MLMCSVFSDGSPSAYYISMAVDPSLSDTVLFFLQGGGQCYSEETCRTRPKSLMSSRRYTPTLSKEGIFDGESVRSSVWGATKVFVPYCSSDGWIGDAAPSELTWGYHFRGQRNIRSALNDLISKNIINSQTKVLFGGGSAGARGMMNNVDFLAPIVQTVGATVIGAFLDSPYTIDIVPYNPDFVGFQNQTKEIYNRYNVQAIIPSDCASVYTDGSGDGWKCLYGQYRMPFIKTRYLIVASQYDSYQLSYNVGREPMAGHYLDLGADYYARTWSQQTHTQLKLLSGSFSNHTTSSNTNFYHSWACYNHDVSETSRFYTLTSVGVSQRDAVEALQFNSESRTWIEECNGIFCGSGCDE